MLVGDQGRVIPFRHFKALTFGVSIVLILSLCALILLGVLYTRQNGQIDRLQENLEQLRAQNTKFRDEKDLYLTQLIALKKQSGTLPQKPAKADQLSAEGGPPSVAVEDMPASEKAAPEPEEMKPEPPAPSPEPPVKWSADIRNFQVSYDNRQGALSARFRVYNTSRPKKRLVGKIVVVFKAIGDPPGRWAIEPEVPLNDEIPVGKNGRVFNIRNYQTETFKTLRRNDSPKYDLSAVYVFSAKSGELIGKKELPFNVDYSPPAPVKPAVVAPKPVPEKPSGPPEVPQTQTTESDQLQPAESEAAHSDPSTGQPPDSITTPDSPVGQPSPATPTGQERPEPRIESNDNQPPEPGTSESIPQTPAPETKPAQEGDTH
jgi:hypothetical protein